MSISKNSEIKNKSVILGIDPGTTIMGYGIILVENNNYSLLTAGIIKLDKINDAYEKLKKIYERTQNLIKEYKINEVSIESPFFGKNAQSMLKLGRAQGVAIAAVVEKEKPVTEYSPRKIKQSLTGNGNASKEQVASMVMHLLKLEEKPVYLDATDALAVALCHAFQKKTGTSFKKTKKAASNWGVFIKNNPDRIK